MSAAQDTDRAIYRFDTTQLNGKYSSIYRTLLQHKQGDFLGELHSVEEAETLFDEISNIDKSYPGGIDKYLSNANRLLHDSIEDKNSLENYTPCIPSGVTLDSYENDFLPSVNNGMKYLESTVYVIVAGGLGERLGYKGIKLSIPLELCTEKSFLQYYIEFIKVTHANSLLMKEAKFPILVIMTSNDTYDKTLQLLQDNHYFGLNSTIVKLIIQNMVPALEYGAKLVVKKSHNDHLQLDKKPHGHGDVHTLLLQNGILNQWMHSSAKQLVILQDTNYMAINTVPSMLSIMKEKNYLMCFAAMPRKPGEAVGAVCKMKKNHDSDTCTSNKNDYKSKIDINDAYHTCSVEYNILESFLKENSFVEQTDKNGYSKYFPGNSNTLAFELKQYIDIVTASRGVIPEFVNPKYTDSTLTKFKYATRLECLMQDIALLYKPNSDQTDSVGYVVYSRDLSFSPVKNNLHDGAVKFKSGFSSDTSHSCENDYYTYSRNITEKCINLHGGKIHYENNHDTPIDIHGVTYKHFFPVICMSPYFASNCIDLKNRFSAKTNITIYPKSILIFDGNIEIENLTLEGVLFLRTDIKSSIKIKNLKVRNKGWELNLIKAENLKDYEPKHAIKGFHFNRIETYNVFNDTGNELIIDHVNAVSTN